MRSLLGEGLNTPVAGPGTLPDKMPTMLAHSEHTLQLARETPLLYGIELLFEKHAQAIPLYLSKNWQIAFLDFNQTPWYPL